MAKIVEVRNSTAEFLTFVAANKEEGVQVAIYPSCRWKMVFIIRDDFPDSGIWQIHPFCDRNTSIAGHSRKTLNKVGENMWNLLLFARFLLMCRKYNGTWNYLIS